MSRFPTHIKARFLKRFLIGEREIDEQALIGEIEAVLNDSSCGDIIVIANESEERFSLSSKTLRQIESLEKRGRMGGIRMCFLNPSAETERLLSDYQINTLLVYTNEDVLIALNPPRQRA